MKREQYLWKCPCGNRVSVSAERIKLGLETCPSCGRVIGSPNENDSPPSVADTQTINVRDMARMAQEGIDVDVSGEWNTSIANSHGHPPNEDDAK
ncbi:MAG: hypothetical protein ACLP5H_20755 [Desulfomonilaceae bacterium]